MYRLHGVLAVAGVLGAAAALAVALRATTLQLPAAAALVAACGSWIRLASSPAQLLVLALAGLGLAVIYRAVSSAWLAYRSTRAFRRRLERCGELAGPPSARLIDDPRPLAFCAGLLRPRIYVSTGAVARLTGSELRAVLAHEAHHVARHDPLRLFLARVGADALFFLPVMRGLRRRYAALAELAADEAAVAATGETQSLASAMLTFGETHSPLVVGASGERIDHLCGAPGRWGLPVPLLLGAVVTLAALAALVLATAQATMAARISAPALLMQVCDPIMLLVAGLAATRLLRFARTR